MHRGRAFPFTALLVLALAWPAPSAASDSPFSVEPKYRATIRIAELPAGATLEVDVERLAPRSVLGLYRCSEPCDHAKLAGALQGTDDGARRHTSFHVDEAGRHYLWIEQMNGANESGPVRVRELKAGPTGFHAAFDDGSTVDATLVLPSGDAAAPPATRGRDRVEIVSVEPASAPRGIESDFTVELEIELATLSEGVVMVGFNNAAPTRYGMSKTVALSGGVQRVTVHTRAMVVDWQDHGHFGLQANIGPKADGMKWIPLAGTEREIAALP